MARGTHVFADRKAAGVALGHAARRMRLRSPITVLALPRGGVPVGYEVARALHAPLDVLVVRKIGLPGEPEVAIGAIAAGGVLVQERAAARYLDTLGVAFQGLADAERVELERRERAYRADAAPLQLAGQTVLLVDDGLATGCTMLAALRAARKAGARSVVVAAPVASQEATALVGREADAMLVLETPPDLFAIGQWYENFGQVEDAEVCSLLTRHRETVTETSILDA